MKVERRDLIIKLESVLNISDYDVARYFKESKHFHISRAYLNHILNSSEDVSISDEIYRNVLDYFFKLMHGGYEYKNAKVCDYLSDECKEIVDLLITERDKIYSLDSTHVNKKDCPNIGHKELRIFEASIESFDTNMQELSNFVKFWGDYRDDKKNKDKSDKNLIDEVYEDIEAISKIPNSLFNYLLGLRGEDDYIYEYETEFKSEHIMVSLVDINNPVLRFLMKKMANSKCNINQKTCIMQNSIINDYYRASEKGMPINKFVTEPVEAIKLALSISSNEAYHLFVEYLSNVEKCGNKNNAECDRKIGFSLYFN